MFSHFGNRTSSMAFAPYKTRLARRAAASYAAETLAAFLQGQERAYAVHDALRELQALFGAGADLSCKLIKQGLASPDENARVALFEKAMDLIGRQVRGDECD